MVFNLARRFSLTVGALAVAVVFPSVSLAGMQPSPAILPQGTVVAVQPTSSGVEQLKLTEQQTQKIRALRKTRNQEIAQVLNATQRKKLVQSLRSGTKLGAAMQTLNLSADQKQKIGAIVQQSNQAVKATLTPTQQQQLETFRKQHQTAAQTPIE